LAHIV